MITDWKNHARSVGGERRILPKRWSIQTGPASRAQDVARDRLGWLGLEERPTQAKGRDECYTGDRNLQRAPCGSTYDCSCCDYLAVLEPRVSQRPHEVLGRTEAIRRQLLQRLPDRRVHIGRNRRTLICGRHGLARDDLAEHRLGGAARIGRISDQHLVQNGPQGIGVGGCTHGLISGRLFRAHVVRRAQAQARFGQSVASSGTHSQCDPEICHDRLTVLEQDVARFDISVDDSVLVRVLERTGNLRGKSHRLINRKLFLPVDAVTERLTLHIRHDVEKESLGFTGVEERKDVRMLEIGGDLDLSKKAFGSDDSRQFRLQDLESDIAVVLQVLGEIYRRHTTFT